MEKRSQGDNEAHPVDRNIASMHELRRKSDVMRTRSQRFADTVSSFLGTTQSLYLHLAGYGVYLVLLLFVSDSILEAWHLSAGHLSMFASIEAIFLAVFVLTNQRRTSSMERINADLHLQLSLLCEHEITRLARATELITKKLGIESPSGSELSDITNEANPQEILAKLSEHERKNPTHLTSPGDFDFLSESNSQIMKVSADHAGLASQSPRED